MRKLILCCIAGLCLVASSAEVQAQKPLASKLKTDPRADAELQKMSAAYQKLGDFSVVSLDTSSRFSVLEASPPARRWRATGRFGSAGRAALRIETLSAQGQSLELETVQLNDGATFYQSKNRLPATITALADLKNQSKSDATTRFFLASPGLRALSLVMQSQQLPLPKTRAQNGAVTFKTLKNGDSQIEAALQSGDKDVNITLILAPSGYLKKIESQLSDGLATYSVDSLLSTPVKLRGADNFRWANLAPAPNPNFSIPGAARVPFDRAAKLYGALDSLAVRASSASAQGQKTTVQRGGFRWNRRGLLRFEDETGQTLTIVDGKTRWSLRESRSATPRFSSAPLGSADKSRAVLKILGLETEIETLGGEFEILLLGESLLMYAIDDFTHLRARVLPSQLIGKENCDVVEVVLRTKAIGSLLPASRRQEQYFFAQSDGRLMRITGRSAQNGKPDVESQLEIESQSLNPIFQAEAFRFVPPKNAVAETEMTFEMEF